MMAARKWLPAQFLNLCYPVNTLRECKSPRRQRVFVNFGSVNRLAKRVEQIHSASRKRGRGGVHESAINLSSNCSPGS